MWDWTLVSLWCGRTVGRAYGHVITKFSRMGRLPHFISYGPPYTRVELRYQNLQTQKLLPLNSLFKAISIFLTSMEEVILLGLPRTTKSSFTWSSGGNAFSLCLNKDLGGTLGRELNVDFFLVGLLEVGELLWDLFNLSTWIPRSVISFCSLSVWSAFS